MDQILVADKIVPHPDKFGYYQVGDRKTYSKLESLEWQKQTRLWSEWNFNRDAFDRVQWHQEPPVPLWDLYKVRARQIREAYDYCVIFYSGGSDSQNVLHSWIDADCRIDEVATFHYFEGAGGYQGFMNDEVYKVAIPTIKALQNQHSIRHRLIDISQDLVDLMTCDIHDYKYMITKHISLNNHAKVFWRQRVKDWADIIASGRRLCFVWGSDKPQIFFDKGYYLQFFDIVDNCVGPHSQRNFQQGYFDELFYWTPDLPQIIVKQAHTIKNFCQTVHDSKFYQPQPSPYGYNCTLRQWLTADAIKLLLYPTWDPTTFCDGKTRSVIWSDRDSWFIQGNLDQSNLFRNLCASIMRDIDPFWLHDTQNPSRGIKCHTSPRYSLEKHQ